jgi:hypothetical protein
MHTGFWWGNLREGDGLEEVDLDSDNIKMDLKALELEGVYWMNLFQKRDK